MSATLLLLGVVAVGVDVGWRELPDGGLEYIIQIDPSQLDSLRDGVPVLSSVPPGARVRSYRIVVGTDALPREGDLLAPTLPHDQGDAGAPVVAARPSLEEASPVEPPWSRPETFEPAPGTTPISPVKAAVFDEPEPGAGDPAGAAPEGEPEKDPGPAKPWLPFTLALIAFFGSLGGMVYFGWVAWDYRAQYRMLLDRVIAAGQRQLLAGPSDETVLPESCRKES